MGVKVSVVAAVAVCWAASSVSAGTIADSSFEAPNVGGAFAYNPVAAGAAFIGDAGVTSGYGFDPAPDGVQVGFLQTTDASGAEIDLAVSGLDVGKTYSFSFLDDQRGGYGVVHYTVSFAGNTIGAFSPEATGFTARTTDTFVATATFGTLVFASPALGYDNGAALDDVTLNAIGGGSGVPEPASWALMFAGVGLLGGVIRGRRRAVRPTATAA